MIRVLVALLLAGAIACGAYAGVWYMVMLETERAFNVALNRTLDVRAHYDGLSWRMTDPTEIDIMFRNLQVTYIDEAQGLNVTHHLGDTHVLQRFWQDKYVYISPSKNQSITVVLAGGEPVTLDLKWNKLNYVTNSAGGFENIEIYGNGLQITLNGNDFIQVENLDLTYMPLRNAVNLNARGVMVLGDIAAIGNEGEGYQRVHNLSLKAKLQSFALPSFYSTVGLILVADSIQAGDTFATILRRFDTAGGKLLIEEGMWETGGTWLGFVSDGLELDIRQRPVGDLKITTNYAYKLLNYLESMQMIDANFLLNNEALRRALRGQPINAFHFLNRGGELYLNGIRGGLVPNIFVLLGLEELE